MSSLDDIRQQLEDDNEESRHLAVQRLSDLGVEALPLIGQALGDKSWRVRKAALEAMLNVPGPEKMDILLGGIRDENNAGRRNTCMEALIRLGEEAVGHIPTLLEDSDADVRKFGVDILGNIEDVRVPDLLTAALEDEEDNVAAAAAEYLGKKRHQSAIPSLVSRMERGDFWVKYGCLQALGEIGDPAAGEAVIRMVEETDLRKAAVEALGKMGVPEAQPFILEALFSGEVGLRRIAILAAFRLDRRLKAAGESSPALREGIRENAAEELVAYLKDLLRHDDQEVRASAIFVLGAAAGKEAVDPLLELLPQVSEEEQRIVAEVLQGLPEGDLPILFPRLRDDQPAVRRWVAAILGRCASQGAVPHLIGILEDGNGHVRCEAARALGDIGDQVAVAPLIALLGDPYPDVRKTGMDALVKLGQKSEELRLLVLNFLDSQLDSQDQDLVANALRVVAGLGGGEVMGRLEFCLKDERSQVRRAAVAALGIINSPEALKVLRLTLTDEDAMVRREAVQMLGESNNSEAYPYLVPMLQDEDMWVRARAVQAVAGLDLSEAQHLLMQIVAREETGPVRLGAIRALGGAKTSEARDLLCSLVDSSDRESRMAAIEALRSAEGKETIAKLLSCLEDEDWSLRSAAVRSLGAFVGEEHVRAALSTVADEDEDSMVRQAAAAALGRPAV